MYQGYKLHSNKSFFENQPIFRHNTVLPNYGKAAGFQSEAVKKPIRNKILRNLSTKVTEELMPMMESVTLDTGEYIYQPEDVINYLYFPESAIVSDFQILEDGKTMEVAMTGREGVVGITSVFNPHPSSNWLQVSISGKAWRIDTKTFRQEFNDCQPIQTLLFDYMNLYITQISQKVICSSHHSVEERLCCWLLMIHDRCGMQNLPLTQEQIAGFLGVHRPSITLITQALREKGIIDYRRGKIFIQDRQQLEKSSCDCYSVTKI